MRLRPRQGTQLWAQCPPALEPSGGWVQPTCFPAFHAKIHLRGDGRAAATSRLPGGPTVSSPARSWAQTAWNVAQRCGCPGGLLCRPQGAPAVEQAEAWAGQLSWESTCSLGPGCRHAGRDRRPPSWLRPQDTGEKQQFWQEPGPSHCPPKGGGPSGEQSIKGGRQDQSCSGVPRWGPRGHVGLGALGLCPNPSASGLHALRTASHPGTRLAPAYSAHLPCPLLPNWKHPPSVSRQHPRGSQPPSQLSRSFPAVVPSPQWSWLLPSSRVLPRHVAVVIPIRRNSQGPREGHWVGSSDSWRVGRVRVLPVMAAASGLAPALLPAAWTKPPGTCCRSSLCP